MKERPSGIRFYGPKILILGVYYVYRITMAIKLELSPSKLPGVTVVAMIIHYRQALPLFASKYLLGYEPKFIPSPKDGPTSPRAKDDPTSSKKSKFRVW